MVQQRDALVALLEEDRIKSDILLLLLFFFFLSLCLLLYMLLCVLETIVYIIRNYSIAGKRGHWPASEDILLPYRTLPYFVAVL